MAAEWQDGSRQNLSGRIVNHPEDRRWNWEITDANRSGSSGDLAKLFKNEGTKQPGVLAVDAPSPEATLMAREVVQNSWDAARELQTEIGDEAPDFEIDFVFGELVGRAKEELVDALDLSGLAHQASKPNGEMQAVRSKLGLKVDTSIDHLDDPERPLRILKVVERGTTGMYGPWKQARSKLYLALVSVGYTKKEAGAGGSYGYGKAGLISSSAIRTVVAYSCFRPHPDEPGVTRRLLGMTYWGQHETAEADYTGFARYGQADNGFVVPFENDEADRVAELLGLDRRDPTDAEDLGTTFMLIEPLVDPEDLTRALARNWWPAIEDRKFDATVVQLDAEGKKVGSWTPRPRKDQSLLAFIRAYELAVTPQDNIVEHEFTRELAKFNVGGGQKATGRLGLVADLQGWSYTTDVPDDTDDTAVRHCSMVALIRSPRMVVEYFEIGSGVPYVRGAFVASDEIDDLLRQTEPKAHDAWRVDGLDESVDPLAPAAADNVLRKVKEGVRDFRKRLKPPPPKPGDVRLSVFQDLARKMLKGEGKGQLPPPKAPPRDINVSIDQELEVAPDNERIRVRAKIGFALSEHHTGPIPAQVEARIEYRFVEDGRLGRETCAMDVDVPAGFSETSPGHFRGPLGTEPVIFEVVSAPYSADWTARLMAACVPLSTLSGGPGEVVGQ
jgi:hypothetical protein